MAKHYRTQFKLEDVPHYKDVREAWEEAMLDVDKKELSLRDFLITSFAVLYAKRIGEIASIRAKDIDMDKKIIRFKQLKTKEKKEIFITYPVLKQIEPYLIKYLKIFLKINQPDNPIFSLTIRQIRNVIYYFSWRYLFHRKYYCSMCNMEYDYMIAEKNNFVCEKCSFGTNLHFLRKKTVRPHAFRHSLAKFILETTKDMEAVRRWLGHTSILTTQTYWEYDLSDVVKQLKGVFFFD